jgi:hypothetical protein
LNKAEEGFMVSFEPITEESLRQLPRWARVAFAAKCGRRVQPLLRQFWQHPHPELLQAFERAITLAEESAAQGRPIDSLEQAVKAAENFAPAMAGIAACRAPGSGPARVPPANIVCFAVAETAVAAGQAAQAAARCDDDGSAQAAWQAFGWAVDAAQGVHVAGLDRVLEADARWLQQTAAKGQITDDTPVGPDDFALVKELRAFRRELPRLLEQEEGRFALVHEDQLAGVFDTYEDALQVGYEKYQLRPFLVKQIRAGVDVG